MNILFWNFRCGKPADVSEALAALARLAAIREVDLLVLADTAVGKPRKPLDPGRVLEALNAAGNHFEKTEDPSFPDHPGAQLYTQFPSDTLAPFRADGRLDVRRYRWKDREEILLAVIHFFDRRNYDPQDQDNLAAVVNTTLDDAEIEAGHTRTVVFGDFNMNPYDRGMTNFSGFGAMMTRELAVRHTDSKARPGHGPKRFYNPAWTRLGRALPCPPGTHYWGNVSKPSNVFWHLLDQVLVRPGLFPTFQDDTFQIITSMPGIDGEEIPLIANTGMHWKLRYSDHLPILFRLDLTKLGPMTRGGDYA